MRNALLRGETRLLTLIGPPGIGKTSLSLAVARDVQAAFADGACFVALAPITDPALVLATLAQTLGVTERADQSLLDQLKAALQTKRLLLLLDNFEQLLDAAPLVVELLEACVGLKALITSRAALHVRGEQLYALPPLLLPDLMHLPTTVALARTPAVALLVERAQAVLPDFRLATQNAAAVAAICVRLDGLPLALELAAARIKLLSPQALLARLEQRLAVLTDGARDLPLRQQTLRAAIAWSYELLGAGEQALFARLGVFVGGCTLEAATAVCKADGALPMDVLDGLATLVDTSLLLREEGRDGEPRFVMLETIREYALERLEESGDAVAVWQRHAACYLTLAEQAAPLLRGSRQQETVNRLEQEHNNLRSGLRWFLGREEATGSGMQLAGALWRFWSRRYISEGRTWLEYALARGGTTSAVARTEVLFGAGMLAWTQGDYMQATERFVESLNLCGERGDKQGIAYAQYGLGEVAWSQGDYQRARSLYEESLALFQELNDTWGSTWPLKRLGSLARAQGDFTQAWALYQDCLGRYRQQGDKEGAAGVLSRLGPIAYLQDDHRLATALCDESLALFRELDDAMGIASVLVILGDIARMRGSDNQAAELYQQSLGIYQELGFKELIGWLLCKCGVVAQLQGNLKRALVLFKESLTLACDLGDKGGIALNLAGVASVAKAQGQSEFAVRLFGAAEFLREALGGDWDTFDDIESDRNTIAKRTQLDNITFTAMWAEGRAMSLEQAIAYALNATSPAPPPSHPRSAIP